MPSHKIHVFVDRKLFGKSYWRLHRKMDMPYLFLGRKHRVLFHDPLSAVAIAQNQHPDDQFAKESALVHIQMDCLCSRNPTFKKQLEYFAEEDAKERKRCKKKGVNKKKPESPDELEKNKEFLDKLVELRRLAQFIFS